MNKYKIYFYCLLTAIIVWVCSWFIYTPGHKIYIGCDIDKYKKADIGILLNCSE